MDMCQDFASFLPDPGSRYLDWRVIIRNNLPDFILLWDDEKREIEVNEATWEKIKKADVTRND